MRGMPNQLQVANPANCGTEAAAKRWPGLLRLLQGHRWQSGQTLRPLLTCHLQPVEPHS
jgi:hypothetical protein